MSDDQKFDNMFLDPMIRRDVEFLEENSPDLMVDLGLLLHIFARRDWSGKYEGWTDVPTTWLGKKGQMGQRRVVESLKRLQSYGIIHLMPIKPDHIYKRSVRARYMKHHAPKVPVTWQEVLKEALRQYKVDLAKLETLAGEEKVAYRKLMREKEAAIKTRVDEMKGSPVTKEEVAALREEVKKEDLV